jgi:hypothetical protein
MKTTLSHVGARGIDSVALVSSPEVARRVHASGIDFVLQYLGSVTADIVKTITDASLGFMPVTYANRLDGPKTVAALRGLGLPKGVTVWGDVENRATVDPVVLEATINGWATAVQAEGYEAGLYVGPGCPLTSKELYALRVTRYWHCGARIQDRNMQIAEPECGWCMYQLFPSVTWGGIFSDIDVVQQDFRGRLPTWATKE